MHPSPHLSAGGVEPPTKFSQRGGGGVDRALEGGCWERGGDFFRGGLQLKKKLKFEIFNDKKS